MLSSIRQLALIQGAQPQELAREDVEDVVQEDVREAADLGRTASLSQDGFASVAAATSVEAMKLFMLRVIDDMGMEVLNDDVLAGVARWYDGECAVQNFNNLRNELMNSTVPGKCSKPWLAFVNGTQLQDGHEDVDAQHPNGWNMHLDEQDPVLATSAEFEAAQKDPDRKDNNNTRPAMVHLVRAIVHRAGGTIVNETQFREIEPQLSNLDSVESLSAQLHEIAAVEDGCIHFGGDFARLDTQGYMALATRHERSEMYRFVKRVLDEQGLQLADGGVGAGGLNGMLPYYNGMCAVQSYDKLVKELNSVADKDPNCGGGWVVRKK